MRIKNSLRNVITGLIGQLIITITGFISRTVFRSEERRVGKEC